MEENKKENANINDNENIISKTTVDNVENITKILKKMIIRKILKLSLDFQK